MVSQELDINGKVIFNFVNADYWNDTQVFKIDSNYVVPVIPTGIFQRFPHLNRLYLPIGLNSVRKDDFVGASNLYRLNLAHNDIEVVPGDLFKHMGKLEEINLANNKINSIEPNAFNGLARLRLIELTCNSLTTLKRNVFSGLDTLVELILDNNKIELIEAEALKLSKLKKLSLTNNRVQTLADNVFSQAPNLEWIDLSENGLRTIGQSLYNLVKLDRIYLDDNVIEDINLDSLGRLPSLTIIGLSNSGFKVSNIDPSLTVLYNSVAKLDISKNQITAADILSRLKNFVKMQVLVLSENGLTDIDGIEEVWSSFPSIEHVSITKNQLTCDRVQQIYDAVSKHSRFIIELPTPRIPVVKIPGEKTVHGVVCV